MRRQPLRRRVLSSTAARGAERAGHAYGQALDLRLGHETCRLVSVVRVMPVSFPARRLYPTRSSGGLRGSDAEDINRPTRRETECIPNKDHRFNQKRRVTVTVNVATTCGEEAEALKGNNGRITRSIRFKSE